ncbi:MAG: hypothetical protein IKX40_11480 [Thermoguttaceae bacterium]|nr:hypothetical protein [Thermoguttaceae bacterium]
MNSARLSASIVLIFLSALSAGFYSDRALAAKPLTFNELKSIAQPFPEPQPGSWQFEQKEPGQTFSQYKAGRPVLATAKRKVIYVQILGRMSDSQKAVVSKTVEYLGVFYGLKTQTLPPLDSSVVPISARRIHPMGQRQFNATYICEKVLLPRCPEDAAAYIAFTAEDLFPDPEWNFCFGYALYKQRVGVWSLARNGNPDDPDEVKTVLRRTLRIASHEVGHMFSMRHCIAYKCNMNGVNSLEEADVTPLYLCPECLKKLNFATKVDYVARWRKLEKFYSENGLEEEALFMQKCLGL